MSEKLSKWKCPRCGVQVEKSQSTQDFFEKQSKAGRTLSGTVTCSGCQGSFPIEDVYSGRYDVYGAEEEEE